MEWIRIRSWHAIRNWSRVPGRAITLCGRAATGETSDTLPEGKSCENCLRIVARKADA
jgi:hypothetical protein